MRFDAAVTALLAAVAFAAPAPIPEADAPEVKGVDSNAQDQNYVVGQPFIRPGQRFINPNFVNGRFPFPQQLPPWRLAQLYDMPDYNGDGFPGKVKRSADPEPEPEPEAEGHYV
ncbi:hypothetical protein GTA08_BOTSDO02159 [Botryosphaeria dothidea]|uniref:Uncharacterized protein n=1 Tax=Botryosphaeria dothidea TaxID=55169 RepID=A0A8H4J394_9PEZI|nr:hypothetical protein GTA08_BOTSDO02159 [Botryosphaeria dothidea]